MTELWKLLHRTHESPRPLILALVLRVVEQLLDILPWVAVFATLWLMQQSQLTPTYIAALLVGVLVILLLRFAIAQFGQRRNYLASYRLTTTLTRTLTRHLRQQPLGELSRHRLGELTTLMTRDLHQFEFVLSHVVSEVVAIITIPCLALLSLYFIDWRLALCLTLPLPVIWLLQQHFHRWLMQRAQHDTAIRTESSAQVLEYLAALPTLKLFNRCDVLRLPLKQQLRQQRDSGLGVEAAAGVIVQLSCFLLECGMVLLLLFSALWLQPQALASTQWLFFIIATAAIIQPLLGLSTFAMLLKIMSASAAKLNQLLDKPLQPAQGSAPQNMDIVYDNVTFSYGAEPLLQNISFSAPAGQTTAIVGASGVGKSTLLALAANFYPPQQGEVRLGGLTLDEIGTDNLYDRLAFVMQDVQLFDGTLGDNLRLAAPQASDHQLDAICQQAGLQDLLARLPEGLNTRVGENAGWLSGGERQRLSLARALLKNAPLLLLDEATAAIDRINERQILQTLRQHYRHKTVLVVAHRLDTLMDADNIVVIEQGRVSQQGNHTQLLATCPHYQQLWHSAVRQ